MKSFLRTNIKSALLVAFLLQNHYAHSQSQTFTSTGVFTVPTGVTSITVEAWGGGGKGGTVNIIGLAAAGGGGGAYSKKVLNVTAGNSYTATVGLGSTTTAAGGDSWFSTSTSVLAKGGQSVANNSTVGALGGQAASCIGDLTYSGGTGGNGGALLGGGGGSSAGDASNGNNGATPTAGAAPSNGGAGGNGALLAVGSGGSNGNFPGGGGGGAFVSLLAQNGGTGANGRIIVTWINPEINVQGNATNILDGDTTPNTADWTDFGSADINTGLVNKTYTIQNLGTSNLTIGAFTFSGINASDFSIFTAPATTIAASGSTTFTVRFNPSAAGLRSATLSIVSNDLDENPYDFALQGLGTEQEINVLGNATTIVDGDATPTTIDWTDFGSTDVASGTISRTFTIQNTGTSALTIGAISFSGANASDFTVTTFPSASVASASSSTFVVTFNPSASGVRTATISIVNNDSDENPYDFTIQGIGTVPEINVKGNYTTINDDDTSPSANDQTDFGSVSLGSSAVVVTYTIENTGTTSLTLGAISFSGVNATNFNVVTLPSATVVAGGTTTFQIGFNPTTIGIKTATIAVINNDSDENPYDFAIVGSVVQSFLDTDNDTIADTIDIDDDNDGILDSIEQTACLTSSIATSVQHSFLNETFGTGTTRGMITINNPSAVTSYCYEDGIVGTNTVSCPSQTNASLNDGEYTINYMISDASGGPTNLASWSATDWTTQLDHTPGDTNGRMAIFNADTNSGVFYETTLNGLIPNVPINYSFWVLNIMNQSTYAGSALPNITVEFSDLSNTLISTFNTGSIGRCSSTTSDNSCVLSQWQQFTASINLGNVSNVIVRFKNNVTTGIGNNLALDDISIIQNFCDSDGDGIANSLDLDTDNDGISDIEEAGFKQYSNGLETMDPSIWSDTNSNGLYDTLDASISGASYAIYDTDADSVPNFIDLDSDNDSFFDIDEAGLSNGDGDINGDGVADGADTDGDGIVDFYDTKVGFGTLIRPFAQNTDGLGNADYMQLDSDANGIKDIYTGLYSSLDANNDGVIDGTVDTDKDGILDALDTNTTVKGSPRDLNRKLLLEFDGRNDYGQDASVLGGLANASLMAWIDLNTAFSTNGVVIGQDKFQLRVTNDKKLQAIVNSTTLTYATNTLNTSQWYHVGAVYGDGFLKLYLNGALVASVAASGSINADTSLLTIGKNPSSTADYFKGRIDEIRLFDVSLTDSQIKKMVYQEIQDNGGQIRGSIIPKNIEGLSFVNLIRYYRMDVYKDDIIDNYATLSTDVVTGMKIYNHKNIYEQQAPMPFVTERSGDFSTAVNSPTNEVRGLDCVEQDWSIIHVKNDITETTNTVDLGLIVDSGVVVTMDNDTKIQNDWYLKLDGKIDLQGKSQLLQTTESDLDETSAGFIERDQQGQSNKFNYNYWSSPVGSINTTTNNNAFTVNGVLRDATDPNNIQNITWTTGYNGAPTSPITLSSYWIFKFQNVTPVYANWAAVGQNGSLLACQGFTMKGSGALSESQNYTFVGKPNNGTITSPIAANNANLSGNPYASALDADAFIKDNLGSTTGTLYFWEHYGTNASHVTTDYQGGYATRTLVGGTPPVAPAGTSGLGSSSRIPGRFIPVGQGFLLYGNATGGTIVFNNNQRAFIKETDVDSNDMFKTSSANATVTATNNSAEVVLENTFAKIRLGFNSTNNYHRQILLGFMNENATSGFDLGYDARLNETLPSDMYFLNGTEKLNIQGEGFFATANSYPLGIKTAASGLVKIMVDGLENFDQNQNVYIYDAVTELYHDVKNTPFEINLPAGTIDTRFSLRFSNMAVLSSNQLESSNQGFIIYTQSDNTISIKSSSSSSTIESVTLYTMLGQLIQSWNVKDNNQTSLKIPVNEISAGTYVVKVHTSDTDFAQKISIK